MILRQFLRNQPLVNQLNAFYFKSGTQLQKLGFCSTTTSNTNQETNASIQPNENQAQERPISKAMKAYLERAKEHDEFMKKQLEEFKIGKRHLANMMGENPDTFTQADIDNAIEYLFPSGLFEPKARPIMKPPEEVFPQRKAAEFDVTGKPYHYLFYTGKPNYYQTLHDAAKWLQELNKFEDSMIRKKIPLDPTMQLNLAGSDWLKIDELNAVFLEIIGDKDYENFVLVMNRLYQHPYSYRAKDFIEKFRKKLLAEKEVTIPKLKYDEDGIAYITTYECLRKRARGHVTVKSPGTGKITINNQDITYFNDTQPREQVLFPLIFTGMHKKVDVEAHVEGGGPSGQAGAVRWGVAMGLRSFLDSTTIEKMKMAGLLQRDYRKRERKKPGQKRARKKFTWKKR